MKKIAILTIIAIFCGNLLTGQSKKNEETLETKERKMVEEWRERLRTIDVPIEFYGKVVDQNGEPVENADVQYWTIGYYDIQPFFINVNMPTSYTKTDINGIFKISGAKGIVLHIGKIKKNGYEYYFTNKFDYIGDNMERRKALMEGKEYKPYPKDSFKGRNDIEDIDKFYDEYLESIKPFKPDKNNPVIFTMRKKGKQEFMCKSTRTIKLDNEPGNILYIDTVRLASDNSYNYYADKSEYEKWSKYYHTDLIVSIKGEGENAMFIFTASDKDSGLICSKELLYIAPESGYLQKVSIGMNETKDTGYMRFYLYFKGREGKTYSIIEVGVYKSYILIPRIWTNPLGSRILEPLEKPLSKDEEGKLMKKILTNLGYKDQ